MFVETLDGLPDNLKSEFVESERDGKKGFQHKDTVALANAHQNSKAEKEQLRKQLAEFESAKAAEIEAARLKALEEARNNKDVDAIEKRYQEQMVDLEKRTAERVRGEVLKEVSAQRAKESASAISAEIAAEFAVDADTAPSLKLLIGSRVTVDENGKPVFLNADGTASSLNKEQFVDSLYNEKNLLRLLKSKVSTTGGGDANGNKSATPAGGSVKRSEMTADEKSAYIAKHGQAAYLKLPK